MTESMYRDCTVKSSLKRILCRVTVRLIALLMIFMFAVIGCPAYAAEPSVSREQTSLSAAAAPMLPPGRTVIRSAGLLQTGLRVDANLLPGDSRSADNAAPDAPQPQLPAAKRGEKSYLIPALEISGFLASLNLIARQRYASLNENGQKVYSTTPATVWSQLRRQDWKFDADPFDTNQLRHPYQGAIMYGFARSSGLDFWESLLYSNLGSFAWEMAGENQAPATNDQVTTGNAGSLLGEALYRISALVRGESRNPGLLRQTGALLISPSSEVNRLVYDNRYSSGLPATTPAHFWRFSLGASLNTHMNDILSTTPTVLRNSTALDFTMAYGLPGKPGYAYTRPLDYFDLQLSFLTDSENPVENIMLRGLLIGRRYEAGQDFRGIWGLYGSYDYISPYLFRVSSTAVSLGTTGQYWVAPGIALQGSVLGGVGFGAAGTETVTNAAWSAGITRDYHYGITPQGLVSAVLHFGDRTILDVTSRLYYVSGSGSDDGSGSETISRSNAGITVRLWGRHALGAQFTESLRIARFNNIPTRQQAEGTIFLVYTYLGDARLGAVEWRDNAN